MLGEFFGKNQTLTLGCPLLRGSRERLKNKYFGAIPPVGGSDPRPGSHARIRCSFVELPIRGGHGHTGRDFPAQYDESMTG